MSEITRHFTSTTFVVSDARVLLHLHAKQRIWLPPGGHIERDELPHDAAVREVQEETGLLVRLHSEAAALSLTREMACDVVPQPAFILVEDINPHHQHIDFTYFALVSAAEVDAGGEAAIWRTNGFAWFGLDELHGADVPENVRVGARYAVQFFAGRSKTADTMTGETIGV